MSKVSMWVKLPLKEGVRDQAVAAIQEAFDNVANEAGTLLYLLHTDGRDENALYFYELYTDMDALGAHGGSDWFKEFSPKLGAFMAGRPEMVLLTPVGGKGL